MSSNCDPLTIAYIAGGFSLAAGILGAYAGHILTKARDSGNSRTRCIDEFINTIGGEIKRIRSEKYTTTKSIGDTAVIKTLVGKIEILFPDISLANEWVEYEENEHKRRYQDPGKKEAAINALNKMIHILNSHKG